MFIKKHFFVYQVSKDFVKAEKFVLKGFDQIFEDGVLLIEKKNKHYNFYLPSIEGADSFNGNVFCIFSNIEEYIYENGLLFVKEKVNNDEFVFTVIEPNAFSWYLTEDNLPKRKAFAPKIPCSKNSEIEFLDFKFFHGIFTKVNGINYFIGNKHNQLTSTTITGDIRASKIFDTVIISSKIGEGEAFFENGKLGNYYDGQIRKFKHIRYPFIDPDHYTGYLCYNSQNQIKALRIGSDIPNRTDFEYSYMVDFDEPIRKVVFFKRIFESSAPNTKFPKFAIDIWLIETLDYKKKYLLQGIGADNFSTLVDEKDFNY